VARGKKPRGTSYTTFSVSVMTHHGSDSSLVRVYRRAHGPEYRTEAAPIAYEKIVPNGGERALHHREEWCAEQAAAALRELHPGLF